MPIYEFKCKDCDKTFEDLFIVATDVSKAKCPNCNSTKIEKLLSSFASTGNSGDFVCSNPSSCPSSENCGGSCSLVN